MMLVLANTLCLLDFNCEKFDSIIDKVKEYTTEDIPMINCDDYYNNYNFCQLINTYNYMTIINYFITIK